MREPSHIESLKRLQEATHPTKQVSTTSVTPVPSKTIPGIPDEALLKGARRRLKDEGIKLRTHLTNGCKEEGYPCDCCEKTMINVAHALEDILAIQPSNTPALSLQNWITSHRDELPAYVELEQKRGLELAAELRLLLKACGVSIIAPLKSLRLPAPKQLEGN